MRRRRTAGAGRRRDHGSMSVEMVLIVPILALFISLVIGLGRAVNLQGDVQAAAREGARAASLERTYGTAQAAAQQAASAALPDERQGDCTAVSLAQSDWQAGGVVRVTFTCDISMAELSLPGVPGTIHQQGDAAAPLDTFRGTR